MALLRRRSGGVRHVAVRLWVDESSAQSRRDAKLHRCSVSAVQYVQMLVHVQLSQALAAAGCFAGWAGRHRCARAAAEHKGELGSELTWDTTMLHICATRLHASLRQDRQTESDDGAEQIRSG